MGDGRWEWLTNRLAVWLRARTVVVTIELVVLACLVAHLFLLSAVSMAVIVIRSLTPACPSLGDARVNGAASYESQYKESRDCACHR